MPDVKTQTLIDRSDPALAGGTAAPRLLNSAAWLEALAALEAEFKTSLDHSASKTDHSTGLQRGR